MHQALRHLLAASLAILVASALAACSAVENERVLPEPAAPLAALDGSAYQTASHVALPQTAPQELSGLHNVFHLSDRIVSGSEPHGEAAFEELAAMGVKTILSVDGKVPDAELARKHGMTYVHVPTQYKGMSDDEVLKIAKTFREKSGPFYVHCFHGKHRGPAAAAIGRLVLDGISREQALAEMRQWCGTAASYEGLYREIAQEQLPTEAETRAFRFDFPAAHPFDGFRGGMVEVSRADDNLKVLSKSKWLPNADHPDLDARHEASKLASALERCEALEEVRTEPDDFREWLRESVVQSAALRDALAGGQPGSATGAADAAYQALSASCTACHAKYRN
ncbi:MAG: cytochrome c [Planctomycetes bacterium]|nr:cytochrome c [Planctomycetota bacterium]